MKIEIKTKGLDRTLEFLNQYPRISRSAQSYSLWNVSGWLKSQIYDWIKSAGQGTWPDFHALTRSFVKSGGQWTRRRRFLARHNWNWLSQFVRSKVRRNYAVVKFGKAKTSESRSFEQQARRVEGGHETRVTPPMRRLMGATKTADRAKTHVPGKTFFPIRKETTVLKIDEHPIMRPVFRREKQNVPFEFEDWYVKGFERQSRKI
jgi:hypothetical protein